MVRAKRIWLGPSCATCTSGFRRSRSWADFGCCIGFAERRRQFAQHARAVGYQAPPPIANCGNPFGLQRGSLAGSRGSSHKTRQHRNFTGDCFAADGWRRIPGALESSCADSRHRANAPGCAPGAPPDSVGSAGGMLVGGSEYLDDFRHPQHRLEHRVSPVELE